MRERAVRMVFEHYVEFYILSSVIKPIVAKISCGADTRPVWVWLADTGSGKRDGITSVERERIKVFEPENRQLQQVDAILKKASAYFAQVELDRPFWK